MSAQTTKSHEVPALDLDAPIKVESVKQPLEVPFIERNGKYLFMSGIFFVLVIFFAAGCLYYLASIHAAKNTNMLIKPVETRRVASVFNKSDWTIEVLNGSRLAGVAKSASEVLSDSGFNVIKVGNASSKNYSGINVFIQAGLASQSNDLLMELQTVFPNATISGDLNDSTVSARIIIGSK